MAVWPTGRSSVQVAPTASRTWPRTVVFTYLCLSPFPCPRASGVLALDGDPAILVIELRLAAADPVGIEVILKVVDLVDCKLAADRCRRRR